MSRSVHIVVPADSDQDDCLSAAAEAYIAEHPELEGYDLEPRWTDEDDRESVTLTVPAWAAPGYDGDPPEYDEADHLRAVERDE